MHIVPARALPLNGLVYKLILGVESMQSRFSRFWHVLLAAGALELSLLLTLVVTMSPAQSLKYQQRGDREEGVMDVPPASVDLRLASFVAVPESKSGLGRNLNLKYYVDSPDSVFITASEVIPRYQYYMKAGMKGGEKGWWEYNSWKTSDVLDPLRLRAEELGVVARLGGRSEGSGIICPVILYTDNPPSKITRYSVVLVPRENLREMAYTVTRKGAKKPIIDRTLRRQYSAGMPLLLSITIPESAEGWFALAVKCKLKGQNQGPTRTYRFYHKRDVM